MASRLWRAAVRHPLWTTLIVLVLVGVALTLMAAFATTTHTVGYGPR
jgi:hypothetical protein